MQLRRALLLFAIVLGFAAVAASIAPPPDERDDDEPPRTAAEPPVRRPEARAPGALVTFEAGAERPSRRRIAVGEPATVAVEVEAPGQVEVPGLGLVAFAEPGTAAVFDVLVPEAGRYEVTYAPLDSEPRRVGVLEVAPAS